MTDKRPLPLVVLVLLGACVCIEAVLLAADTGLLATTRLRATTYTYGAFWSGLLQGMQPLYGLQPYVMFVSYAFLHGGLVHLAVNMFTLASLGQVVCDRAGTRGFLLIYAAAVVGGAVGFGLLEWMSGPMVGASGGLFGLIGAILAWNSRDLWRARRSLWPTGKALVALLLLNIALWWITGGLLAWQTHLGGFIAGWAAALVIRPGAT